MSRRWMLPATAMALLVAGWGWGEARLAIAVTTYQPGVRLRIVQPNIPQAAKFKPENRRWIFDQLVNLSRTTSAATQPEERFTHVIWPETALPFLLMVNGRITSDGVRDALATVVPPGGALLLGAERADVAYTPEGKAKINAVYNSLFVLGEGAQVATIYDKTHLVPFGEYVPLTWVFSGLGFREFAKNTVASGFISGTLRPAIAASGSPPFAPLICYEAIFSTRVQPDNSRAMWLLNITNDAWYGTSTGPYQHFEQARIRAIEEGVPLIRAANTGISAIVDAYGRIIANLPLNQMGVIDGALPAALPQPLFGQWGEISLIAVAFLILLLYRFVITVE